jgi:hypothetical protein
MAGGSGNRAASAFGASPNLRSRRYPFSDVFGFLFLLVEKFLYQALELVATLL